MTSPGEIYWADLEPSGPRPVIIVSRGDLNRGAYVVEIACTSARFSERSKLRNCVPFFAGQFGFTVNTVAQCKNIFPIKIAQIRLTLGPIGILDDECMREVVKAIGYVIGCDCEPI